MPPSTGCGPFRSYDYMYDIMNVTIAEWPGWIQGIVGFLTSAAFGIPCFVVLVLIIYYARKKINTYKRMNQTLSEQLHMEGHDGYRLQEISRQGEVLPVKKRGLEIRGEGEDDWVKDGLPTVS
ncbi:hypothetical protein LSAT2_018740 [Lamellibrachia satsuma]|nr:hypothetical protein LSAT2_018740 [Lamellibrachia satsuma]